MLNSKFIKIIIAITVVLLAIIIFLYIRNNNTTTETVGDIPVQVGSDGRPVLNTGTSTNTNNSGQQTNPDTSVSNANISPNDFAGNGPEDMTKKKIEKILFNWNITKDENSLREAVVLSENIDNEIIFEAWIPFMGMNSAELVKIINTSTDIQKTKSTIRGIFEWYIELSGEYEKLSSAKKQQLTNQYNQLK